jgi:hypothetical protein
MKLDPHEVKDGIRWFFVAGIVAVVLSLSLLKVDDMLTYSPGEARLGATLQELRKAQAGVPSRSIDERELAEPHREH